VTWHGWCLASLRKNRRILIKKIAR